MPEVRRRSFLTMLAAATPAGVAGCAEATADHPTTTPAAPVAAAAPPTPERRTDLLAPPPATRVPLPGGGTLSQLPGHGDLLAITVDDGVNTEVVRAYTQFAADTGVRLTYFVNGTYPSWTDNLTALRPLVDSGQIQLGNHTWSHPDLTTLTKDRISEISRNDRFLNSTYGVDAAPYYRPPYGRHNANVDAVAANLGYTVPTLWSGSLSDSTLITEDYIVEMAEQILHPADHRDRASQPSARHPRLPPTRRHHPFPQPSHRHPQRRLPDLAVRTRGG